MSHTIKTTVVGSYPVPQWLKASPNHAARVDAIRLVLDVLEKAGIDVVAMASSVVGTCNVVNPLEWLNAFRRFHADTASFGSRAAIECGLSFFGLERMLFATDSPFDPEQGPGYIRETLRAIAEMDISEGQRDAILAGNAERLLKLEGNRG